MPAASATFLIGTAILLPCTAGMLLAPVKKRSPAVSVGTAAICLGLGFPLGLAFSFAPWIALCLQAALFFLWGQFVFSTERTAVAIECGAFLLFGAVTLFACAALYLPDMPFGAILSLPVPQLVCFCLLLQSTAAVFVSAISVIAIVLFFKRGERKLNLIWLLYPLFPLCQYALIDRYVPAAADTALRQVLYLSLATAICVAADVTLAFGVRSIQRSAALRTRFRALRQQIDAQSVYYRQVTGYYEQLRRIRHDVRNHAYTMQLLLKEQDADRIRLYCEELRKSNRIDMLEPVCAHPIADLFLSQKAVDLRARGLDLRLSLRIPAEVRIANGDLLSALDNLIECAAAACAETGTDRIVLEGDRSAPFLILKVRPAFAVRTPLADRLHPQNASAQLNALHRIAARYAGSLSVHSGEQAESTVLLLEEGAQR